MSLSPTAPVPEPATQRAPAGAAAPGAPAALRYGVGLAAPFVALAFSLPLRELLASTVFLLFFAAVTSVAWYAGRGPSVATALVSVPLASYFVEAQGLGWTPAPGDLARAALFLAVALLIGSMREAFDAARRAEAAHARRSGELAARLAEQNARLEAQSAQLQQQNALLEEQAAELEEQTASLHEQAAELEAQSEESQALAQALEESHDEIARALATAREADRAKSAFLATMSHELRTPLNAMIGYAEILALGIPDPIPASAQRSVERIRLSARHLLELIEEVLTYARAEAGREGVAVHEAPLADLLDEAAAITEPLAAARGLSFRVEAEDRGAVLRTDARKVRQVLVNLLGNAVKFTERGEVVLSAMLDGGHVVFQVRDTGLGIAPEHRERIYEPFWQVETAHSARSPGTGLGLSVSRQLARLLGGELSVESEPGRGSTFTVRLPLIYAGPSSSSDSLPSLDGAGASGS